MVKGSLEDSATCKKASCIQWALSKGCGLTTSPPQTPRATGFTNLWSGLNPAWLEKETPWLSRTTSTLCPAPCTHQEQTSAPSLPCNKASTTPYPPSLLQTPLVRPLSTSPQVAHSSEETASPSSGLTLSHTKEPGREIRARAGGRCRAKHTAGAPHTSEE